LTTKELQKYNREEYHIQIFNVWRPLVPEITSAPLALCSRSTIQKLDLIAVDKVHPDHVEEGIYAQFAPTQRWYWLSQQTFEEVTLFLAWDSDEGDEVLCPPHAAFQLPKQVGTDHPRKSIETRYISFTKRTLD